MHETETSVALSPVEQPAFSANGGRFAKSVHRRLLVVVLALLAVHAGLLAIAASVHSPTIDEVSHLPSGICHLQLWRFEPYRVNPPLVRLVAALPAWLMGQGVDARLLYNSPGHRDEAALGRSFMRANGAQTCFWCMLGRWCCIPFSLVGAFVMFSWARTLYGTSAGLAALIFWCFDPNILAHGQLITPDLGATALGLLAVYTFWCWLRQPVWSRAVLAGITLGLAELTKFTWIVLYPAFIIIWALWSDHGSASWPRLRRLRSGLTLVALFFLSILIIHLGYGLQHPIQRLGDFDFVSGTLSGLEPRNSGGNRFRGTYLEGLPIPLPADYVLGIDTQKRDFERAPFSYLGGEWSQEGWWYYYLYGLAIKEPLGSLLLLAVALVRMALFRGLVARWRDEMALLIPSLVVFVLVSSQTSMNHHIRYALPALPFAMIWASQAVACRQSGQYAFGIVGAVLVLWAAGSSLAVFPHSLSYFNELVGGPLEGHKQLLNSNIEWAQDLLFLKRWQQAHPESSPLHTVVFANYDPRWIGIEAGGRPPPSHNPHMPKGSLNADELGPQPGWFAVGVTFLHSDGQRTFAAPEDGGPVYYEYFARFQPVDRAGFSIYIYHIDLVEANRVRAELGLPILAHQPIAHVP